MIIEVRMFETNQSFTAQPIDNDRCLKVDFTMADMLIPTTFKEEAS